MIGDVDGMKQENKDLSEKVSAKPLWLTACGDKIFVFGL